MASTELLASKIVVLEEEPQIPAIPAQPSAVLLLEGVCERGPINDPVLVTSFEEFQANFGGFKAGCDAALGAYGFFYNGGQFCWVNRVAHYTDLSDPDTCTATKGSVYLQNDGSATPGSVGPSTSAAPFDCAAGQHIDIKVDGAGAVVTTLTAGAADLIDAATYPILAVTGETITFRVNGGMSQAAVAAGGETSAIEIAALINASIDGVQAIVVGGHVRVSTDRRGTSASLQCMGGTLNARLAFPLTADAGSGNVADVDNVSQGELETLIEASHSGAVTVVRNGDGTLTLQTTATGSGHSIQVDAASTLDLGFDHSVHSGTTATPTNTVKLEGKTPGAYANSIKGKVEAASNGNASDFNLKILVDDVVKETFPNLSMTTTATNYIETVVNNANFGSRLVTAIDQLLSSNKRPANATTAAMTGGGDGIVGLVDADYIGLASTKLGLFAFDNVNGGRLLSVPGVTTPAVQLAMLDYAENWRNRSLFCTLEVPEGYTGQQAKAYVEDEGIFEYSEMGAIYWPWIRVVNPSVAAFGTDQSIVVPPSAWVAGKYAANDQALGGIYESPAGIGGGFGIIRGVIGVEDDPSGKSIHQVVDEAIRDLVYPVRINPITKLDGTSWHIDGGRTLKSSSNFPNIGERRGVIFIEQAVKSGLLVMKHRFNNAANRAKANRMVTAFLTTEMNKGAFRTTDPATAFFVDTSEALNPLANQYAGIFTMRIGLATNKPNEFIVILVTQDTRALVESLEAA